MSNIKALRNRIKSVKSTQKITKAMRMVSASKLNKAKEAAALAHGYRNKIQEILNATQGNLDYSTLSIFNKALLLGSNNYNNIIAIIYSSDRGLCGGFNSSMFKKVKKELGKYNNLKLITVGKKLNELLIKNYPILANMSTNEPAISLAAKIRDILVEEIKVNSATQVVVYYTKFKNALTQIPTFMPLIPLESLNEDGASNLNVEFEGEGIIDKLTNLYLESNLVANMFESKASEEASRMTAMDNATRNAGEMIEKLTLKMNRTRQAQITKELIEVISGAETV